MLIVVVNLDKNADRLATIDRQLKRLSLPYERFRAVYGKELSEEEKSVSVNRLAFWCLRGYPIRDGEIGCALSHLNIYRRMVREDIPLLCVLEDDADPHDCLPEVLMWLDRTLDVNRPIVALLSNHGNAESSTLGMFPLKSGAYTDGYVITKRAAEVILKENFPIKGPSDSWSYWKSRGYIELYQVTPTGCKQRWEDEGYKSDVTPDNTIVVDVRRMSAVQKVFWKMKRAIGMMIAKVLY